MTLASVETLYGTNSRDIAAMARKFADDLESGIHGTIDSVTLVSTDNGELKVFTWGDIVNRWEAAGILLGGASLITVSKP